MSEEAHLTTALGVRLGGSSEPVQGQRACGTQLSRQPGPPPPVVTGIPFQWSPGGSVYGGVRSWMVAPQIHGGVPTPSTSQCGCIWNRVIAGVITEDEVTRGPGGPSPLRPVSLLKGTFG